MYSAIRFLKGPLYLERQPGSRIKNSRSFSPQARRASPQSLNGVYNGFTGTLTNSGHRVVAVIVADTPVPIVVDQTVQFFVGVDLGTPLVLELVAAGCAAAGTLPPAAC